MEITGNPGNEDQDACASDTLGAGGQDLGSLTARIIELNLTGIEISRNKSQEGEARRLYRQAQAIANDTRGLNPDLLAWSFINEADLVRYYGGGASSARAEAESLLGIAAQVLRLNAEDVGGSRFGVGRLRLEEALLYSQGPRIDDSEVTVRNDMIIAMDSVEQAIACFEDALEHPEREIFAGGDMFERSSVRLIQNHLLRSYGILAETGVRLADMQPEDADLYLRTALDYATLELWTRVEAGESSGYPLVNAYHTLSNVETAMVRIGHKDYYAGARQNLEKAIRLTRGLQSDEWRSAMQSVLSYRMAFLEFSNDPNAEDEVRLHLDSFFRGRDMLSANVIREILPGLIKMVGAMDDSIQAEYQDYIGEMYGV
ncbi:hypothetical protein JW868_00040 [Candidatus Woesearchaeota archaeon]|nr:hypothetical protein [Candidatus Woesearchaeota archaeon]